MATSGTIAATVVDVTTLMEHAFRRCGKMPSTISAEQQIGARESLGFLLTSLVNRGISLWCVQNDYFPMLQGQPTYALPNGTSDVLNAAFRTETVVPATYLGLGNNTGFPAVSNGYGYYIVYDMGVETNFTGVLLQLPALSDGNSYSVWTCDATGYPGTRVGGFTVVARGDLDQAASYWYFEVSGSVTSRYWSVRDDSTSTTVTFATLMTAEFRSNPTDLPMSPYNRDDYFNLPNKTFQANRSLQYWFEKVLAPRFTVWPVPNGATGVVVMQTQHQIEDVGLLTNTLAVPQRWYEYVIFELACRVALELPAGELPPGRLEYLEGKAAQEQEMASDGENDGAPFRIQPNLRGYNRG